jgi:hypothetical protein
LLEQFREFRMMPAGELERGLFLSFRELLVLGE